MGNDIDITSKIERLELFEDRLSVRLGSLSAFLCSPLDPYASYLTINGEVTADNMATIDRQFVVCAAVYDELGRVVAHHYAVFSAAEFAGFDTLHIEMGLPVDTISKIRLYPKLP